MLTHSKVLFVKANGTPMQFYMRPSAEKEKLRPLIEHGGGVVTSKLTSDAYKLVEPGSRVLTCDENTVRSKYIVDCVESNTLFNIEDYLIKTETEDVSDISDTEPNSMKNKNEFILSTKAKNTRARKEYSVEDQQAIINFICTKNRYSEIKGTRLWKDMESKNVLPSRTWQSMKEHFLKQIYPNLKAFNLSKLQIQKFIHSKNEKGYLSRENLKLHNLGKGYPEADRQSLAESVFSLGDKNCYTTEEDQKIIDYIFEDGSLAYRNVKGTVIWKDMERISLTNHSWQSMKERFLKRIVPNISKYKISPTHLRRLSTVVDIKHLQKLMTETIKKQKTQTSSDEKTIISESEDKTQNITGTVDKKLVHEKVGEITSKECSTENLMTETIKKQKTQTSSGEKTIISESEGKTQNITGTVDKILEKVGEINSAEFSTDTCPVNNKESSVSKTALEDTTGNKKHLGETCVKSHYFIKKGLKDVEENTEKHDNLQNVSLESTHKDYKNITQGENERENTDKKLYKMSSDTSEDTLLSDNSLTLDSFDANLLGAAHQLKTLDEKLELPTEPSPKKFRTFSQECLDAAFGSPVKVDDIFKDLNDNWSTSEEEEYSKTQSKPKLQPTEDETNPLPQREKSSKRKSETDQSTNELSLEEEMKGKSEPLSAPYGSDPANKQTKKFRKLYCPENDKNYFDKSPNVNDTDSSILKQSVAKLYSETLLLGNGNKESPKIRNTEEHHSPVTEDTLASSEKIGNGQLLEGENSFEKWSELLNTASTTISGIKEIVKEWSLVKTSIPFFGNARIIVENLNQLRKVMKLMLTLEKYSEHCSVEEKTFLLKCLAKEEEVLQTLTGVFPD